MMNTVHKDSLEVSFPFSRFGKSRKMKFSKMHFGHSGFSKTVFLLLSFIFVAQFTYSTNQNLQENGFEIKGNVTDTKGEPLIGVSILAKGQNKTTGTITDFDGNFSLKINDRKTILQFSYIGYKSKTEEVGNRNFLKITLNDESEILDEVVVVGYGTQKKKTVTGAVVSVNTEQITTSTNSNLQQNIAGKMAGVKVVTNSSEPGSFKSHIDVRGMGEPLVVIDGVPCDFATFNQLSAAEIDNISVLKDASAAVYGMRAGNGVILVTTKRGSEGKAKIEYNGIFGWSHMINVPRSMNAYDWANMINEVSESHYERPKTVYTSEQMEEFRNAPKFDLHGAFMREYSPQTNHIVNISGSAGKNNDVQYFLSGGYYDEQGAYKSGSMNYDRFNFRSNVTAKLGQGFTINANVGFINSNTEKPYQDAWNIFKWMWFVTPINPETGKPQTIYANNNPDYPAYFGNNTEHNPSIQTDLEKGGFKRNKENRWNVQGTLTWDVPFVKGLSARFNYNYQRFDQFYQDWNKSYTLYSYKDGEYIPRDYAKPTSMIQDIHWRTTQGLQTSLNYTNNWNGHGLNLLGVFEQSEVFYQKQGASRLFTMDFIPHLSAGDDDKTQRVNSIYPDLGRRRGVVGKVNYDYNGKYLVEFSFRYDGSSKYHKDKRWGFFPSTSVGWRISEEKFFRSCPVLDEIDNLKIRGSYGITGDDGGAAYQWASGYIYPGNMYYFGDNKVMSVIDRGAINPNFTWYKNKLMNLGLDLDMLNGKLGLVAEYYIRNRSGLPAKRILSVPGVVGVGLPDENLNSDRTSGYEILVYHKNNINGFTYSITGNMMYSRTKRIHVEKSGASSSYRKWRDGYASDRYDNVWWSREWAGVIKPGMDYSSLPIEQKAYQNSSFGIGDYYYKDLNGDGFIDDNDVSPNRTTGYPLIQYGFTFDFGWKGIDLNLHFMGAAKKYVTYNEFLLKPYNFAGAAGALDIHKDRWHQDGNGNWIEGFYPRYTNYEYNYYDSDRLIQNAGYLRLKSLELGYSLPKKITKKVGIEKLRLFANGFNLFTITGLKYMDPEYPGWNIKDGENGDDTKYGYIYPISMNFNFGLNIMF